MIEKPCDFCGIEIYWNKTFKRFHETNSGIIHDSIACQNVRDNVKTENNVFRSEQERESETKSYDTGYRLQQGYREHRQDFFKEVYSI